jgi:hypothetical protein
MFFGTVLRMALGRLATPPLRRIRIRAVVHYLEAIRTVRRALIDLGAFMFCLAIIAGGAVLMPLALCLFMPWQPQTKALVACAFGVVYIVAPLIVAIALMSEKRWMRITHADTMVNNVLNNQ